jgi:glycosyltransferase involved in cell wall biosynthesis
MSKRKIILFFPSIEDGGVEKNFFIIANYLASKQKNISLITASRNLKQKLRKVNIIRPFFNIDYFSGRKIKYFYCLSILFVKLIFNRDVLVFSFQANVYCVLICKILGVKVIIRSNSSPEGWSKNYIKSIIYKSIFPMADKIIVNSLDFKKNFEKKFKINAECIFNPLNKNEIIKKSNRKDLKIFNQSKLKLINIGRLVDQKNQITILKALNLIKKKIDFQMLFIGKGELKQKLVNYINNNKLTRRVKIINFKKNPFTLLKQADVFILSSKFEGLPNVLLEALILKKYIISSNCPTGPREILQNGKGGDLFNVNDYKKLSKLLLNYKKNSKSIKKKIKIGYNNLNRYDFNQNLKKYNSLIEKYLNY